jgi:hypothetical protein
VPVAHSDRTMKLGERTGPRHRGDSASDPCTSPIVRTGEVPPRLPSPCDRL